VREVQFSVAECAQCIHIETDSVEPSVPEECRLLGCGTILVF
jgi:hypothetical protein